MSERINVNGDYLIIARKPGAGLGYYHTLSGRNCLVENIIIFLDNCKDIEKHDITIYELKEINE